jgi:hypothetical protein
VPEPVVSGIESGFSDFKKTAPFLGPQSKEAGWQETQMQGAASAEEAARVEGSRTGKKRIKLIVTWPLFYESLKLHLPRQTLAPLMGG